ncbi:CaiB/BaiF CoA transferase family protein [Bacillus salipaludis]|uniref:CaiB/BaiF CoA transferase family protein n=1 Tax=Bacillus salipaludis TaxID=2547811 RepID=A0ABW8RHR4_9BACI
MKGKPLNGVKILDLGWIFSAPFATSILHDLGAEVVKVERPITGDRSRLLPPFQNQTSGYFFMLNRGKKSISIDLKSDEGKRIFLELIKHFDVVVENFVAHTMDKLGLGYDVMKEINPRIIYASLNGFGSSGPYSELPCIDGIAQAMGGLMSQNGLPDGQPLKTGPAVADTLSGVYLTVGILSALIDRNRSGNGQRLEVSMMDSVFSVLEESVIRASMTGDALPARGNLDPLGAPWNAFQTADDKWVMVCTSGGDHFYQIYQLIGRGDLAEKFKGDDWQAFEKRAKNLELLNSAFAVWAKTKMAEELLAVLIAIGIPAGEVKNVRDLIDDPHVKERNMVVDVDHPILGKVKLPNLPIKFFENELGLRTGEVPIEPQLGEHNQMILQKYLGLNQDEIQHLKQTSVIYDDGSTNC